jgi:hypothetical protein
MAIGKEEVVEVLSDFRIRSIRFSAGPINVNFDEYGRVSDFVDSGAIKIKPTKTGNKYFPQINTLHLRDGDARNDLSLRTGIFHECTHIVSDINRVKVSRLHDEAAAYLAQYSFLKLLDPTTEAPPIRGIPANDLMRVSLGFVDKYGIGQPNGFGAVISASDIDVLGQLVQRDPEYSIIKDHEMLAADGVKLDKDQADAHALNMAARQADRATYEGWLLSTIVMAQTGPGVKKKSAYEQLRQHFFMVYLPVATMLLSRFLSVKTGDKLSEQFDKFATHEKHELLGDLRIPKPPG